MKTRPAIGSIDGKFYTSDKKTDALNKFFSSVSMTEDPNTVPSFNVDKNDDISLSSITINPSAVFEKLTSLKCGKAPGPDGWPVEVFKKCAGHLCDPRLYFYKIIGEWYSATRLENWSNNIHIQKEQQN